MLLRQKCAKLLSQRKACEAINIKMKNQVRVGREGGVQERLIDRVGGPMTVQIKKLQNEYQTLEEANKRGSLTLGFQRT